MERISINTENFLLILHNKSRAIFTLLNEWRGKKIIIRFLRNNFIDSRFLSCIREIIYRDPHSLPMNNLLTRISKQQHLRWSFSEQCFISIVFFISFIYLQHLVANYVSRCNENFIIPPLPASLLLRRFQLEIIEQLNHPISIK